MDKLKAFYMDKYEDKMIIGNESEIVEFKKTTGEKKEALESICAILNKHSVGSIYFGVDNDGHVVGQNITDSTKKDVSRWIYETIEPRITVSIDVLSFNKRNILKVNFSGHNKPYSYRGRYFTRIGTENRIMSSDELKWLIKNNDYGSKWEEELTDKTIDDLDEVSLKDFFDSAKLAGRISSKTFNKERILSSLGLVNQKKLNNACFALFGKECKISLKLAQYVSNNKVNFVDLKLLHGNIYTLVNEAINYVLSKINWKPSIKQRKRDETPEIPEQALREIIVNAFAHANYETIPEIEINIYPNKIEIYNPGSFPDNLTPLDFVKKNLPSYKRNKLILDILFRSKDVEKSGTGFQRVNDICQKHNIDWNFRKDANGFMFEFIRTNVHINVHINKKLNIHEQEVFNLILNNELISKKEISIKMNKSEKTIQRIISSLIKKKCIKRIGSNKTGHWKAN